LAILELFTPFEAEPERHSRLYKISHSMTRDECREVIVVQLDSIYRSCHLLPVFGPRVDRSWTSENV
ncbi:hypothetical protein BV25DRAFT_1781015, partial [Artomyces pyxidatus]